jgi:hypothetical protein
MQSKPGEVERAVRSGIPSENFMLRNTHGKDTIMDNSNKTTGTLALSGEGEVRARPDMAVIQMGVITTAKTAQEAVRENAHLMARVIETIRGLGVPVEDLQTVGFSISPIVDYDEKSPTYLQIIQYRVEDSLRIKTDVEKAGRVLDAGVAAGANVAGSLSFGLRDESKLRDKALQAAVNAAHHNAEIVARAMKLKLTGARTVEVNYGGSPMIVRGTLKSSEFGKTPIEPGTMTISASIRVVYEYRTAEKD